MSETVCSLKKPSRFSLRFSLDLRLQGVVQRRKVALFVACSLKGKDRGAKLDVLLEVRIKGDRISGVISP